jgi:hypothetical protein
MVEAGGVELQHWSENTQLTDSRFRQNQQKRQKGLSEVHNGYTPSSGLWRSNGTIAPDVNLESGQNVTVEQRH